MHEIPHFEESLKLISGPVLLSSYQFSTFVVEERKWNFIKVLFEHGVLYQIWTFEVVLLGLCIYCFIGCVITDFPEL